MHVGAKRCVDAIQRRGMADVDADNDRSLRNRMGEVDIDWVTYELISATARNRNPDGGTDILLQRSLVHSAPEIFEITADVPYRRDGSCM